MGRRQLVVGSSWHRPTHGASVLAGIRVRVAAVVLRVPNVLRKQDAVHAAEAVQPHVEATDQGGQVRPELLRVGRGTRETDRQQRGPAQLLPVPQVSVVFSRSRRRPCKLSDVFSFSRHSSAFSNRVGQLNT